ncbi:VWA domain-containing protein [Agrobacterium rhizogenes]|nr:VWA domain-containing protein [Rhizobium rhizogenes]NTG56155.1 VWA domain-containing protein [Rhizobium rhizogenes]NTH01827.1 VWA domain-containing protein [Rhizobium rhizogenes]NTI57538.1 VWA domain-containing protein [Rhizobium rhizogenes]
MISDFHFLRPWLLLALLLPLAILWLSYRSGDVRSQWRGMIAPHLLDSLVVDATKRSRLRPAWLLAIILVFGAVAAAGPTWQREMPPFVEDTASLVVAVDLSQTMDAIDVSPSRLERAKLKIRDVIAARPGARTAIIAYAGSAHLVLPLTEDASLIETYVDALATRIMPKPGKDTTAALKLAAALLKQDGAPGTILLMTDGIETPAIEPMKSIANGIVVLGIGTAAGGPVKTLGGGFLADSNGARVFAKLDIDALNKLQAETGADVATITDDGTDVRWINQRIRTNFTRKAAATGDRWHDMGWWLLPPLAILFALSFRKGWVVRAGLILLAFNLASPGGAHAGEFTDMWLTRDQQGRMAFERGDSAAAADLFQDPMWKGIALYRIGRFQEAIDSFASIDTAESWYDQGNALLRLSKFDEAIAAYSKALEKREDWLDAEANLAIAKRLSKVQKDDEQEEQEDQGKPDKVQFDDKGKEGVLGRIDMEEQTSEMWMKNIQVSPADLMARKFSLELQEKKP